MSYLKEGFTQNLLAQQSDIDDGYNAALLRATRLGDLEGQHASQRAKQQKKGAEAVSLSNELVEFTKLSALRATLGLVEGRTREEAEIVLDLQGPTMDLFREILSQVKNRVSAWGGTLYFVYLPGVDWAYLHDDGNKQRSRVLDLNRALGIPVIDMVPAFQAQADPLSLFPFREPGHYNEKGHRLVADEVLKTLFLPVN